MVPKVTSAGRSFKGAARYYLHDRKADTSDRVAFAETLNLPTDDAHRAVAHMIDTATHANELKKSAGLKGGRPLQKPVYTFSLAWHPSETPSAADQLTAAREALQALGMHDRQAVIIAHRDANHPHVHVMVNRVCPTTGRAASDSNDQLRLSRWAEDYERRHGQEFCPKRRENNAARKSGQWRKDDSLSRPNWMEWKKAQTKEIWDRHREETAEMKPRRKAQFDALWNQKQERIATRKAEIKALFKPVWRETFQKQRKELADFDAGVFDRIGYALKQETGRGIGVVQAIFGAGELRHRFIQDQEQARLTVSMRQRMTIRDAGREISKAWAYDRDTLRAAHRAEDQARYETTQEQTREVWRTKPQDVAGQKFEESSDRRKRENTAERKELDNAPEETKQSHRDEAEQYRERRERKRNRTRGRGRKPR